MVDFLNRIGLREKSGIVLGGGRGIGRACSLVLAEAGADITVVDLEVDRAESTVKEIESMGRNGLAVQADVHQGAEIDRIISTTLSRFGQVNVLINVVGQSTFAAAENFTEDMWDYDILHNLKYVWMSCTAVGRVMIRQQKGGSIVNIGSVSGITAAPWHSVYGAAKAGMMGLTRTLAVEWGSHGIRVNCVAPGSIMTPRVEGIVGDNAEIIEAQRQRIPAGRWGKPDDIAGAAVFLASDLCPYVTGQTIVVDGAFLFNQLQTMGT